MIREEQFLNWLRSENSGRVLLGDAVERFGLMPVMRCVWSGRADVDQSGDGPVVFLPGGDHAEEVQGRAQSEG